MTYPVAVFAYNEERLIERSLDAVLAAADGLDIEVFVLINGCRDRTEDVVREYARSHPQVRPCHIPVGDKSNAWNVFVHELAGPAEALFFVDGDVRVQPGAFALLLQTLHEQPEAHIASGLMANGRSRDILARDVHGLAGNLYAVRGSFMQRLRGMGLKLPFGMIGDDSLLAAYAKFDLDDTPGWHEERVRLVPEAGFIIHRLSPFSWADIRLYLRRRVRYALRHWQIQMFRMHHAEHGLANVPDHVIGLYRRYFSRLKPAWRGLDTVFDHFALAQIRNDLAKSGQS